ncbi:MAG: hypothetical protein PHY31_03085 [Smithellaceae bacterium]|nr:hypothetical protein [Smithellaceae bacterium]
MRQKADPIGILGCEVDVVGYRRYGKPPFRVEPAHEIEERHLVADIQKGGELIKQHDPRLLRQGAGDPDPLPLAPRELPHSSPGKLPRVRGDHGLFHDLVVGLRFELEPAQVGVAPHQDDLPDAEGKDEWLILGNDGHDPRQFPPLHPRHIGTVEKDTTLFGKKDTIHDLDQGSLTRAVGTDDS